MRVTAPVEQVACRECGRTFRAWRPGPHTTTPHVPCHGPYEARCPGGGQPVVEVSA